MQSQKTVSVVGENIKRLREKRGLSQKEFAAASGTTAAAMIECGKHKTARYETLLLLSKALGVAVEDLYVEPDPKPRKRGRAVRP